MSERPAKLAKLQDIRTRLPYISHNALASLLQIASQEELPKCAGRKDLREARNVTAHQATPYGPMHQRLRIPTTSENHMEIEVQHPHSMLWATCKASAAISRLITETAARAPPSRESPWRVVIYMDEVHPGNQLAYSHRRKLWATYWSFMESGPAVLSHEEPQP